MALLLCQSNSDDFGTSCTYFRRPGRGRRDLASRRRGGQSMGRPRHSVSGAARASARVASRFGRSSVHGASRRPSRCLRGALGGHLGAGGRTRPDHRAPVAPSTRTGSGVRRRPRREGDCVRPVGPVHARHARERSRGPVLPHRGLPARIGGGRGAVQPGPAQSVPVVAVRLSGLERPPLTRGSPGEAV